MNVYLMRHGEAASEQDDLRRPLTERGRNQVEWVCRRAVAHGLHVFQIIHSGKLRARETAEILARCAAPAAGVKESNGLDPQADPLIVRAEIEVLDRPVALVGHMPHLGRLASLLLTGAPDREPRSLAAAALLHLTRDRSWKVAGMIEPDVGPA